MNNSLFVKVDEKQYGPLSRPELRSLIQRGKFSSDNLVWSEEEGEWIEAEKVEELRSLFTTEMPDQGEKRICAIGGGKGGVGKTVITASLGVGLAALGKQVVMVDADFGGANLHTCMGMLEPKYTFLDFYTLQKDKLEDILLDTPVQNLQMISGACGTLGLANPRYAQKLRFIRELGKIEADYILLDLGGGSSYNVIDYFIAAHEGIVVVSPEPTSVQEGFDFLKICLLRKLHQTFKQESEILDVLNLNGFDNLSQLTAPMDELLQRVNEIDKGATSIFESVLEGFRPKLILNMVMEPDEIKEGIALKTAAAELLSIDVDYLGYIEYDDSIRQSVKDLRPFILHNPKSRAARCLAKIITIKLLGKSGFESFREKIKMRRQIKATTQEYPSAESREGATICSVNCFYWDDCEFQNGGFPCSVRHLEPVFRM